MTRLRPAVIGAGAALLLVAGSAGPASAAAPRITITSPTSDQQVQSSDLTVSARVEMPTGVLTGTISLTVAALDASRGPVSASAAASGESQTVNFPVGLPYNGRYRATITASGGDRPLDLNGPESASAERSFAVAAPPASPAEVRTAVDEASRAVTVTWKRNAEPDMRFYVIQRSKGGGDFAVVGRVDHPGASFADPTTAEAGGDYRYQVVAVRNGARSGEGISSDPSTLSTARVPDPPPPPTDAPDTTVAPGGSAAPGTAATGGVPANSPGALATSGKVDLSGFNSVQSQAARRPSTTLRNVAKPDTGFQSTLPFDPVDGGGELEAEPPEAAELGELAADSPEYRELGAEGESDQRQRSLALFAGGLLATVLLMHVLWVKGEVKRVPLEVVAPEGPAPGPPVGFEAGGKKAAKPKRPASTADWFVPDLGVDDGADRAAASSFADRKVS